MRHPHYDYDYDSLTDDQVAAIQAGLDFMVHGSQVLSRHNSDGTFYIRGARVVAPNCTITILRRTDGGGWWFDLQFKDHPDTLKQRVWDHIDPNDFHGYVRACVSKAVRTNHDHHVYQLSKDTAVGTRLSWPDLQPCVYVGQRNGHHFVRRQEGDVWSLRLAPKGEFKVDGPANDLSLRVSEIPWSHVNGRLPETL